MCVKTDICFTFCIVMRILLYNTEYILNNLIKHKAFFVTIIIPDQKTHFDSRKRRTNNSGRKMVAVCTVGVALPVGPSIFSDNTIVQNVVKLCTTVAL